MAKLSKSQKRQQKVVARKKSRRDVERRLVVAETIKINKANAEIAAAAELAVARARTLFGIADLAARALLADVLRDRLFADVGPEVPVQSPVQPVVSRTDNNPTPVFEKMAGFDRGAWGQV